MLIFIDATRKITAFNANISQDESQSYIAAGAMWVDGLAYGDLPGWGDTLDYFINDSGEISSKQREIILPEPSEMEVLTAKVDYISMVVEGLVLNV